MKSDLNLRFITKLQNFKFKAGPEPLKISKLGPKGRGWVEIRELQ